MLTDDGVWVPEETARGRRDDGVCQVRGCGREATMTATRLQPFNLNGQPAVKPKMIRYCPEHYRQANRFHLVG